MQQEQTDEAEHLAELAFDQFRSDLGTAYEYEEVDDIVWSLVENSETLRSAEDVETTRKRMEKQVSDIFNRKVDDRYQHLRVIKNATKPNVVAKSLEPQERTEAFEQVVEHIDLWKVSESKRIGWVLPDGTDTDVKLSPELPEKYFHNIQP